MRKGRLLARLRRAFRGGSEFLINNNLELSPLARSLKGYNEKSLFADAKAGLNVALLALPQGMAYAVIAGLPVKYGLYCSAVAAIAASFLSSSRHTILGPTNATAFMLFSSYPLALSKEETLPLLVFMVGLFLVLGAYVKIAELIQYVSRSVVVGYITGAAILIIVNQMHNVLGYSLEEVAAGDGEGSGRTLFSILSLTIRGPSGGPFQRGDSVEVNAPTLLSSFGAENPGGEGGPFIHVVNLANSGPGSLREALETPGPRIVVFDVAGVIDLAQTPLRIHEPFLTVEGHSAPPPGITLIRGGLSVRTHDVRISHLRIRPGDAGELPGSGWERTGRASGEGNRHLIHVTLDYEL